MPEHEGVGTHLHFLQDEPDEPLPVGKRESFGCLAELGEETFKTLGERHVCLSVHQFGLEDVQLCFGRRLTLSQRRHTLAQFLQ